MPPRKPKGTDKCPESPGKGSKASGDQKPLTYSAAGVDINRGTRSVELIKETLKGMPEDHLVGGFGGFGGSFLLGASEAKDTVLVAGADGVGTKLRIAIEADKHDTIGIDLVAMCVNDIITSLAKPLFFLDYLAQGRIEPEKVQSIVSGVVEGCVRAGCVLLGGETAEMPGFYKDNDYDLAGFAVGAVEKSKLVDGSTIKPGDILIGLKSSGLHSNGFSLVRHILFDIGCFSLSDKPVELGRSLSEELLEPTRIYVKSILNLAKDVKIQGLAHITGGGLIENPPRMLPPGLAIQFNLGSWEVPPIFGFLQKQGGIEDSEMRRVFNMGLGFIVAVRPYHAGTALQSLAASGERCFPVGKVIPGNGEVLFENG
ncbi:MAG: phosphoribosylformylglycinamidine cyclo-ligase [Firmicutes bacterium]|nr:phosphoribosylformylglycinamidine cyclo-ligase [Bacillota bacterium]